MTEFDDIRPYEDDEVTGVIDRLLADDEFLLFLASYKLPRLAAWFTGLVKTVIARTLRKQLGDVNTISGFQDVVSHYAHRIVRETVTEFQYDGLEALEAGKPCLFVSNHRDIAADSMFVNYALYLSGYQTVRIAVGDNLIQREFATDLMKLNKSFFIKRSEKGSRRMYEGLLKSSKFIHQSLRDGHSVWIAQREGRAKDGWDRTDPAIIKMFVLPDRKADFSTVIRNLNIVPVVIAYEFDPCDELKAKELKEIDENGRYEKPPGEDLVSLAKGLGGYKGRVCLRFGRPLTDEFDGPDEVAAEIDRQILDNLQLFPVNYWALSQLQESPFREVFEALSGEVDFDDKAVEAARRRFEECPEELRPFWLKMYANPIVNKHHQNAAGPAS
ncbi:MAG: 1-acyl-sn-glycerol-3-phosphate acyltransferase [Pseudomonadales bacterium]|nr:1-acyl-sn-glycerol-3-phosphate acyltransferase [Pseudomonadales bacterium]